jgi:hypothetical protein
MAILQAIPVAGARGEILVIVLSRIVAGVEKVFLIVEAYGIAGELLLRRSR